MEYIRFENITKIFGETIANSNVSFSINKGEVLSILGENGSGKTTLLNVLGGIYQQDSGKVYVNGEEVVIHSPKDAYDHGIGMVHQHYKLVEAFSAIENVVLGLSKQALKKIYERIDGEPTKKRFVRCSISQSAQYAKKMCDHYGFAFDPNKKIYDMSVSEKQTLEIIKALFRGVDTLILDEPTAVLTIQEIKHLFTVVKNMKKDGKTVIIITHKLNEVKEISDRVVVMRKGEYIDTVNTKDVDEETLAEMMVGKKIDLDIHRSDIPPSGERLIVEHLTVNDREGNVALKDINFTLFGSEILGIAGVSNSGQRELLEAISGLAKDREGNITFINPKEGKPVTFFHKDIKQIKALAEQGKFHYEDGSPVSLKGKTIKEITKLVNEGKILFYENEIIDLTNKEPLEIRNLGIKLSFVPEDRLGMGLVGNMNLVDNMLLRSYRKGKGRILKKEKSKELAERIVEELDVKTPNLSARVAELSGGNIQKLLVGREISSRPKILMVAYPVRGLDINSSYLIYKLLDEQKQKGTAIIYVGEDLDVLLALTDRILVLSGGEIAGIVDSRKTTKEKIGMLMSAKKGESDA
ncbi:MAG: ABC transporter ATP-binding protein [Bacilli bacterium]|nr:ABC transporter ATP-binding protein [Bacilli bacterium]